jgi:LuxR family maltose regulon positive regulatory protein
VVRARPWLCVYLAWTRHWMGLREQIEECLQHAEQALERAAEDGEPTTDGTLIAGYIAAIRAHHALTHQQIERVVEMAQRAIAFLPEGDYMRCEAAVALGGAYWSLGDVVASEKAFSQARATAQRSGYRLLGVPASCYTGMQQAKQGRLDEAYATYHEALEWATEPGGRPLPIAGFPLIRLGDLAREWNDLEAAGRDLAMGLELCIQLGHADVLAEGYVLLARLQLAQGEFKRALDSLDQAEQISQRVKIDPWITAWADDCRLRLWLSTGDVAAAAHWAQTSGLSVDGELSYQHDLHHVNLARVLIAPGTAYPGRRDLSQALDLLARLQLAAHKAGWVSEEIKILILQALGLESRGDVAEALAALEHALFLAEPCGYVRTFVEEGPPLAHLLRQEAVRGIVPGYVGQLLAALGEEPVPDALAAEAPTGAPIEALSERETEVLELIAQGLTNREIGERLFISLGTVKAHTSSIYGKLGVRSRTQAVAQARALGIL